MNGIRPKFILLLALAFLGASVPVACRFPERRQPSRTGEVSDRNVRYGFPAPATNDPSNREAFLIERPEYTLSYNDRLKTANWVCWGLVQQDIGTTPRGNFSADELLPETFERVTSSSYERSGFDRGHLCNSKDRSATVEANEATFKMTNIMPQSPNNNQRGWEQFESYCRTLAADGCELLIVAGPHGTGGEGSRGRADVVSAKGLRINVPEATWKVVLVLDSPNANVDSSSRMIGIWMPNDQSITSDWKPHVVSVVEVERRTGFRFYPRLPKSVAERLKSERTYSASASR